MISCDLEAYFRSKKIFIDTCSLLHEKVDNFWSKVVPLSMEYDNPVFIPAQCIKELEKHQDHPNSATAKQSRQQLKMLQSLIKEHIVSVKGDKGEGFADSVFHFVFEKFRVQYELLLITQDRKLSKDILAMNKSESVIGKKIIVCRLDDDGNLVFFGDRKGTLHQNVDAFRLGMPLAKCKEQVLAVSIIPKTGNKVYDGSGNGFYLGKLVGEGGEGKIYDVGNGFVAKVYSAERCTSFRRDKLQLMLQKNITHTGICYPTSMLYNSRHEFVGYIMPIAKGKELARSIFVPKPLFVNRYSDWKKADLVRLCITILEKISFLHSYNIVLGDINPSNILVVSPTEVYFVDTDSYQIEGYPCQVGTINFTAPEIQGNNFGSFLRTKGNEYFAVATLLFMILHCGKLPYSQQGGESMTENIRNMEFPYPFGSKSNRKAPKGAYRYMWSHLSVGLKEAFYCTFQKNEKFSAEDSRLNSVQWSHRLNSYFKELDSGEAGAFDKMSEEIFPTRFKKYRKDQKFEKCRSCGQEYDVESGKSGYCSVCLRKKKQLERERKNQVEERRICSSCGCFFEMTVGECEFYRQKGLEFPKRCPNCRGQKRQNYNPYSNGGNNQKQSSGHSWYDNILNWMS